MQNYNSKFKTCLSLILSFALWFLVFSVCFLASCAAVEFLRPEGPPYDEEVAEIYRQTKLKASSSADVLSMIGSPNAERGVWEPVHKPGDEQDSKGRKKHLGELPFFKMLASRGEPEMLSQSKSVVALLGLKKKGRKMWLNMIAFDENELTARRKYFLIVDERPKFLFVEPWESLKFDCKMVLESEVLDEPYANENAKRIAILKRVLTNFRRDIDEVGSDNEKLAVSGMLINQTLEAVLVKLNSSPVLAKRLSEKDSLEFEHMSFDKGRIRMVVVDDIVTVEIQLGSLVKKLKVSLEGL